MRKTRSLHEGGIRQTIVVQWPGTIAPNSVSNDMFVFYDLLPTAADLAGVAKSEWPPTDGISAVQIFEASRKDTATKLDRSAPAAGRHLYYEFCHNGAVNGILPQSYASGWGQAVRFDGNDTAFDTQWKAIAVNSDYTNVLLYNITEDQSESRPLAGRPDSLNDPASAAFASSRGPPSTAVINALEHAVNLFHSEHVENPYWKSSANATDRCCASCFSPGGCAYPCKYFGPHPPPPPRPTPSPPIETAQLVGMWTAKDSGGKVQFELSVGAGARVTIGNPGDKSSCWESGVGVWDAAADQIRDVVCTGEVF